MIHRLGGDAGGTFTDVLLIGSPAGANLFDLQAKYAEVVDEGTALAYVRERHDAGS